MSKQYQVKQVETNARGYKVTRTLSTEDEEEIKALIGTESKSSSSTKKKTKESPKETVSKKSNKTGKRPGVVIDADFTEVKSKKTTTKTKKVKEKPKALPAPKKKESSSKKEPKKPNTGTKTSTSNKKAGVCIFKDKTGRFSVYQEIMGFSLYDRNDCIQQLMFETDASKALKVFGDKIKQILVEDKKKNSP